jgi:hypothetical protein
VRTRGSGETDDAVGGEGAHAPWCGERGLAPELNEGAPTQRVSGRVALIEAASVSGFTRGCAACSDGVLPPVRSSAAV